MIYRKLGKSNIEVSEIGFGAWAFGEMHGGRPHISTYIESGVFDFFQIPYSALERVHENIITKASQAGAGTIVRGGVCRGEPGVGLGNTDRWATWESACLDELLEEGETRTDFMLRFTLSHPNLSTTIVGTKNPEHLAENIRAVQKGPIAADVYEKTKKCLLQAGEGPKEKRIII